ncbi:hypothetical protein EDD18DRAFT_1334209 [Armillaria luteobubalina]|uniref:Uncharacterized protein n=1 Tax=Armillaria luteobubalina TaxID=153913 RepID=A0AA39PZG6_9AGAR|nr:hypothetical protein EDD18DRAFT_1334209 [Armillaria luteobubalina]
MYTSSSLDLLLAIINLSIAAIRIVNEDGDNEGKDIAVDFCRVGMVGRRANGKLEALIIHHYLMRNDLPSPEKTLPTDAIVTPQAVTHVPVGGFHRAIPRLDVNVPRFGINKII